GEEVGERAGGGGELGGVRGADLAAVAGEVRVPHVVGEDDDDVRPLRRVSGFRVAADAECDHDGQRESVHGTTPGGGRDHTRRSGGGRRPGLGSFGGVRAPGGPGANTPLGALTPNSGSLTPGNWQPDPVPSLARG